MESAAVGGAVGNLTNSNSNQNLFIRTECVIGSSHTFQIFATRGAGMVLVSLVGVIGNILSLIVLTRPTMRSSSINVILIFLAICDLAVVVLNMISEGLPIVFEYFCVWPSYVDVMEAFIFGSSMCGMYNTFQTGSIYITVGLSVERLVVVYRPLLARSLCTVRKVLWATLAITTFVIIYTLPYWLMFSYVAINEKNDEGSGPTYQVQFSKLFYEYFWAYVYYTTWCDLFVIRLIPFILLIVLNALIYKKLREANQQRKAMTQGQGSDTNENSVSKMLFWVVMIFLVCNSVQMYRSLNMFFQWIDDFSMPFDMLYAVAVLLVNLNSAINIFIYCVVGQKFRQTFKQVFDVRPKSPPNSIPLQQINNTNRTRIANKGRGPIQQL